MKRSQASLEFLYFVGAALFILIIYLVISTSYVNIDIARRDNIAAQNLLETVRNEINVAGRVENGYSKKITLPNTINDQAYTITLSGREIYITFKKNDYSKILSTDVTLVGTLAPGKSLLISKSNDQVTVRIL